MLEDGLRQSFLSSLRKLFQIKLCRESDDENEFGRKLYNPAKDKILHAYQEKRERIINEFKSKITKIIEENKERKMKGLKLEKVPKEEDIENDPKYIAI